MKKIHFVWISEKNRGIFSNLEDAKKFRCYILNNFHYDRLQVTITDSDIYESYDDAVDALK
jgi:hypothetical protein